MAPPGEAGWALREFFVASHFVRADTTRFHEHYALEIFVVKLPRPSQVKEESKTAVLSNNGRGQVLFIETGDRIY